MGNFFARLFGKKKAPTIAEQTYAVSGMACQMCAAKVEETVARLDGVTTAQVDLEKGILTITGSADPASVLEAVDALGFSIKAE